MSDLLDAFGCLVLEPCHLGSTLRFRKRLRRIESTVGQRQHGLQPAILVDARCEVGKNFFSDGAQAGERTQMIQQSLGETLRKQRATQQIETPLLQGPERRHHISAIDGGNEEWRLGLECVRIVPIEQVATIFLHAIYGGQRLVGEIHHLGNGDIPELNCDLPCIQEKADIRRRDTCRYLEGIALHIVRYQPVVLLVGKFRKVSPDIERGLMQQARIPTSYLWSRLHWTGIQPQGKRFAASPKNNHGASCPESMVMCK